MVSEAIKIIALQKLQGKSIVVTRNQVVRSIPLRTIIASKSYTDERYVSVEGDS